MKSSDIISQTKPVKFPFIHQKLLRQPANGTLQDSKPNRDLSWQVAHNLFVSFKYAWAGISYAFATQRNFRIHVTIGSFAIGLGLFLNLGAVKMSVIGLTIGIVLAMELLNTALESVVDLTIEQNYHPLAKIAKDCAAGAVMISALAAVLVAGSLLVPPLLTVVGAAIGI
jgi:diacylglycerol kinase (ATP)